MEGFHVIRDDADNAGRFKRSVEPDLIQTKMTSYMDSSSLRDDSRDMNRMMSPNNMYRNNDMPSQMVNRNMMSQDMYTNMMNGNMMGNNMMNRNMMGHDMSSNMMGRDMSNNMMYSNMMGQ